MSSLLRAVSRLPARLPARLPTATVLKCAFSVCTPAPAQLARTGGTKKKPTSLAGLLDSELAYELENGSPQAQMQSAAAEFGDFALTDCEGSARFFLTRTVGKQTVRVDVDCTPLPVDDEEFEDREGEEEEESEEQAEGFRVLVTVSEEGKSKVMQFGGMASTYLQLHRVALFDADKAPTPDQVFGGFDEAPVYAGPAFDELDEALKNAFYEYLSARGVDDAFADKLAAYSCDKERAEYMKWLETARNFVK